MAVVGGGAQAELAVVDETHALAVPQECGWTEAGGFPEVFSTAADALFTQCGLGPGERVLITGAAGGVGTAAVQLGAAVGAGVVASVRDAARRGAVADLGAATVIDPAEVADNGPYDVVIELVGACQPQHRPAGLGHRRAGGGHRRGRGGARLELDLLALMATRGPDLGVDVAGP